MGGIRFNSTVMKGTNTTSFRPCGVGSTTGNDAPIAADAATQVPGERERTEKGRSGRGDGKGTRGEEG